MRISLIISFLLLASCGQEQQKEERTSDTTPLAEGVVNQLNGLLMEYYKLKDALVVSDSQQASNAASGMLRIIGTLDIEKAQELGSDIAVLRSNLQQIKQSNDLNDQREFFRKVSENLNVLLVKHQFNNHTVYLKHCPANRDELAGYWLSPDEEIRNPYTDNERGISCGENMEIYRPDFE